MAALEWIGADWGTSNLRVWAVGADGKIRARASSDDGMATIGPEGFEAALLRLVGPWLGDGATPVVVCGMAGARQGWMEVPYTKAPCSVGASVVRVPATDPRICVHIVSGVSQIMPADVMRGEETQLAGLLERHPEFDGVACLPGTHSKWVRLRAGEILRFTTVMTGEVYGLLSRASVLRHSLEQGGFDTRSFERAVTEGMSTPEKMCEQLFNIRALDVLGYGDHAEGNARLSGILIGAELASTRAYWQDRRVAIIGEEKLADCYARALSSNHIACEIFDPETLTVLGLKRARETALKDLQPAGWPPPRHDLQARHRIDAGL